MSKKDAAEKYFTSGLKKHEQGDFEGAIADYNKAIELNPKDVRAYYNRGVAKKTLKQYKEAIADYDKAIELNPEDAQAYYNRGNAKHHLKQYKEAIADYDKAIELNPKYAYVYSNRGFAYLELGKKEEAIKDFNKAIELDPKYADAYNNRGGAKHHLKQYKEAIADYDKAIELKPEDATGYYNRGLAYRELGQKEKADTDSRTWAKLIGESTKEIKETSEAVKSKIEDIGKQTEETQAFQKTLEDFKKKIGKDENKWGGISVGIVLITSLIFIGVFIIYIFFTKEAKSFFPAYFLFTFFSIVSFTVLRIYTSIKKHRLEAENRLAMAKMLAHIENTDNKLIDKEYYQKQFLPELAKVIITPLYPDKNQKTDSTNLAEMIKNLIKK